MKADNAPKRAAWKNWKKWITAAVLFAALAAIGLVLHYRFIRKSEEVIQNEQPYVHMDMPQEEAAEKEEAADKEQGEKWIEISSLVASGGNGGAVQETLRMESVSIGGYAAWYEEIPAALGSALKDSIGEALGENEGWYQVSGHEEAQYLIRADGDEYSLWKFCCFRSEEYPYIDVLRSIYGLDSADDMVSISVTAANMDNTDEGKRIQEEIGRYEITDKSALGQIYDILCGMTCYGSDRWDLIDYGANDESMAESVRLGRYLTIKLSNGVLIDTLKYTAVGGMFYEYGGVAYNRLSGSDKESVDQLLGIEMFSDDGTDASVNESVYQEAHKYSDDIEEIQSAISQAMSSGELPFVISSAIYENPVRIVVTVNTKEEASIEKVKAFDTVGGVVEIVYEEEWPQLE